MNKLEKIIYEVLNKNECGEENCPDCIRDAEAVAAAVIPLIEQAFDAGELYCLVKEGRTYLRHPNKAEYLSELSGNTEQLKEPKTT